jgi:hypothetical protein
MTPGNLANKLLDNLPLWVGVGKSPHVLEVRAGEPLEIGKFLLEIPSEAVNNLGTPTLALLLGEDFAPNLPVEENQLLVNS